MLNFESIPKSGPKPKAQLFYLAIFCNQSMNFDKGYFNSKRMKENEDV